MSKIPTLMEMLKSGVHFGHKTSKRHPKMSPFIFTIRTGVSIIDLNQTIEKLEKAVKIIEEISKEGKTILFVGTKKQAQKIIKKYADNCGMPYVINRWIGGTFTNFLVVKKNIKKYLALKEKMEKGELDKYTKKERLLFNKQIMKLEQLVGGLVKLEKLPDAVFVVDTKKDKIAINESNKIGIPVFAICDTNSNPDKIKCPIPANDDALKSINMITKLIAEAVNNGKALMNKNEDDKK